MVLLRATLRAGKEGPLLRGHPWVFTNAIAALTKNGKACQPQPGESVSVHSHKRTFLGVGHYEATGNLIAIRLLKWAGPDSDPNLDLGPEFYRAKVGAAHGLRKHLGLEGGQSSAYRLVHMEGDGLPGLVVDWYDGTAVLAAATYGMHRSRREIVDALCSTYGTRLQRVYDRSTANMPKQANVQDGILLGEPATQPVTVLENGRRFMVDFEGGQKTGFYCDQRDNRALLADIANGAKVLDACCYTGAFSVYAGTGGASEVHSVDSSSSALTVCSSNMQANCPSTPHRAMQHDVWEYLRGCRDTYDIVVLDPPAFAQSSRAVKRACQGYTNLNKLAIPLVRPGGFLMTYSCSFPVTAADFRTAIYLAMLQSGRRATVVRQLSQAGCHPSSLAHSEGSVYLKGLLLQIH